ncbi:hypothetical protein OS493_026772 [Desmophyllum pertusum]|uniref:Uncharacterized protein n=1 Tax=Desmophyllum pertusum TaxID=174260 RepID=A0A9W9ZKX2_9CNID|nr:hypothetical protein OS493_026772 [Desmophyllum pertusum]
MALGHAQGLRNCNHPVISVIVVITAESPRTRRLEETIVFLLKRAFWTANMKHLLTCLLAVTSVFLFIGTDFANGQYSKAVVPGSKLKIVGCFKENAKSRNIPTLLFSDSKGTNSKIKIDYKNFGTYILGATRRCAIMTKAKKFSFFALSNIGDCYSGKVSATYAKSGSSPSCKNSAGAKCGKNQDCVGDAKSNFVYKVENLPTTPTTKPTTKATTKPGGGSTSATTPVGGTPTAGTAAKLNALTCQNYLVAIKTSSGSSTGKPAIPTPSKKPTVAGKSTGPTVATPTTPSTTTGQSAMEAKVKGIYKGYTCLVCLKTVNASSSTVFLMLQFTCQGQHLKKLVAGLGAKNIIKAECYPPACAAASLSPCPNPCGMATCPMAPTLAYPSICPATFPAPAPLPPPPPPPPPPQCPLSCPSMCAPACNSFCCRSMIRHKSITEQSAKKSSTKKADDFDDDDDDEDDDDDDDNDDTYIDETN